MITDEDLTPINLSDFWDDETESDAPVSQSIEPDYIKRHIERIPKYGDDSMILGIGWHPISICLIT